MRARLALLLVLLAGCTQADPQASVGRPTTSEPSYEPPSFTDTTGALDGIVVADDQLPIEGVRVRIVDTQREATTDAAGRFAFSDLEPGTVVVQADKVGYATAARRSTILAGEVTSATLTMAPVASTQPYTSTATYAGKTSCTISYRSSVNFLRPSCSGLAQQAFPSDRWNHNHVAAGGFVDVLVETSWRPTYSYGNQLYQTVGGRPKDAFLHIEEREGPSPLRILINQTEWSAWSDRHGTDFTDLGGNVSVSTFAAHNLLARPSPVELGLVIDQSYTLYVAVSYHGPLPPDLTLVPDG